MDNAKADITFIHVMSALLCCQIAHGGVTCAMIGS